MRNTLTKSGKPSMTGSARIARSLDCYDILMSQGQSSEEAYGNVLDMKESARVTLVAENTNEGV